MTCIVEVPDTAVDGKIRSISFSSTSLPGTNRTAILANDVTALQQVERVAAKLHKHRALGDLTSGIAHDFNNILCGISASLEAMTREPDLRVSDEQTELLGHCLTASNLGSELCEQLLAYSRQTPLREDVVRLGDYMQSLETFLRHTVGTGYNLELIFAANPSVKIDRSMFQRSITNLLINARGAVQVGDRIQVRLFTEIDESDENAVITVFNPSTPIPLNILDRLFDPFFTTRADKGGTGLGLSVVQGFVQQSRGKVSIKNVPGGVMVRMQFPCVADLAVRDTGQVPETPKQRSADPLRVILVDDNELVLRGVGMLLSSLSMEVHALSHPADFSKTLEGMNGVDLIISDITMPGIDGITLVKRLRQNGDKTPFILMSGLVTDEVITEVATLDRTWIIGKPVKLVDMENLIAEVMG